MPSHKKTAKERRGLLIRQQRFVDAYVICGNVTQAAKQAGYGPAVGSHLLRDPDVAQAIVAKRLMLAEHRGTELGKMDLTEKRVSLEIARIAFFDPRRLLDDDGKPIPIRDLDDDVAACIASLEVEDSWTGSGEERKLVSRLRKYKIADKVAALDKAARILGMYRDKVDVAVSGDFVQAMLDARARAANR